MKEKGELSRRKFISNTALGSIGTLGVTGLVTSCLGSKTKTDDLTGGKGLKAGFTLRPYQLLCAVCSIGGGNSAGDDMKIRTIRENPDMPVTLVCNAGDVFAYQDPGTEYESHGSPDFNRKRDLEVLQRLDLPPGITLPVRIILYRLWERIENVSGICGFDEVTSEVWEGCPSAKSGYYEEGRKLCLSFAVPGCGSQTGFSEADMKKTGKVLMIPRTREERAEAKRQSLEAMHSAEAISVRPHILICAVCQYGDGIRPPCETDNLPEMIEFILKNSDAKIKMAEAADWMMCAPCPSMSRVNACLNVKGHGGLTNQLRDVNVLQKLGLQHSDVMNARELYQRIFERVESTIVICRISKGVQDPSVWDDGCGQKTEGSLSYVRGRELLIKKFGFNIQNKVSII